MGVSQPGCLRALNRSGGRKGALGDLVLFSWFTKRGIPASQTLSLARAHVEVSPPVEASDKPPTHEVDKGTRKNVGPEIFGWAEFPVVSLET